MKALVTGITGQDGAYLARLLLRKGYKVFGSYRRLSSDNFWRLRELDIMGSPNLFLCQNDLCDLGSLINIFNQESFDEVYNLGAQSFVSTSFDQPSLTADVTGKGALNVLEAIRLTKSHAKMYQASTSEMFGKVQQTPQSEATPFYPRSPYGVAKLFAHWMTINYRESYGIFCSSGILFNHESPLRGREFVTRKISEGVAKIQQGSLERLELGNLDARRDWGYADDYVEGMWRILQHEVPDTFVLATGRTETVRRFTELCFEAVGRPVVFEGTGLSEVGRCVHSGEVLVSVNPDFYRPAEVDLLLGDPSKAKAELDWSSKIRLEDLAAMMVRADVARQTGQDLCSIVE